MKFQNNKIVFSIDSNDSLRVDKFCDSLLAFNDEFKRYSMQNQQLVICEIRKGSFEVEFLLDTVVPTLAILSQTNILFDFIEHIKTIKSCILTGLKNDTITPQSVKNTNSIVEPIVNCGDNCKVTFVAGDLYLSITAEEAKQISENAPLLLPPLKKKEDVKINAGEYKKVLFYWYTTCFDEKKINKGNQGIIESIQNGEVAVIFADDNSQTKQEMTTSYDGVDWQKRGYIVDVEVMKKGDKIVKYKIINNYMKDSVVDLNLFCE